MTPTQSASASLFAASQVIPVVTFDDDAVAPAVSRALVDGGIGVIEVTLRTPRGLAAIRRIRDEVPDITVGAGTVTRAGELRAAIDAGASFLVTPGLSPELTDAARDTDLPVLPGVATVSEVLTAREYGFTQLKLFPAEPAGGLAFLRSIASPVPDVSFFPTGGIGRHNFRDYLALANVAGVGGSWLTPREVLEQGDWQRVTQLAREATS